MARVDYGTPPRQEILLCIRSGTFTVSAVDGQEQFPKSSGLPGSFWRGYLPPTAIRLTFGILLMPRREVTRSARLFFNAIRRVGCLHKQPEEYALHRGTYHEALRKDR